MLSFLHSKTQLLKLCILVMLAAFTQQLSAQSGAPSITTPTPPSPNAASLGQYGEIPVGLYTGIPNINIPIYEINAGGIKLPISLSYHSGGIKVEEIASWVGLGWSLNAGGVITKQVRGLSDDSPSGYFYNWQLTDQYLNGQMTAINKQLFLQDVLDGVTDSQQDIYYYNFGNESGKFILDRSGVGICIPVSKNKIEFGTFLGAENCWKITSTSGQIFYFTDTEVSNSQIQNSDGSSVLTPYNTTSWFLTKIVNTPGTESVDFTYEDANISFKTIVSQTKYHKVDGTTVRPRYDETSFSYNTVASKRLNKIVFTNGQIDFIKDTQLRADLPADYKLNSLIVKNADQSFYKRINFYQSYTTSNDVSTIATPEERKHLFLDSISTLNVSSIKNGTYKFSYNSTALPSRNSFSQDHWGYFNHATNNGNFVPDATVTFSDGSMFTYQGADKSVNTAYGQAGILQAITYPLKGRTEFQYENHTANNVPASLDVATNTITAKILSDGVSTSYSTTFNVTEGFGGLPGVNAEIEVYRVGCPNVTTAGCPVTLLFKPDGGIVNINSNSTMYLPIGTYTVTADLTGVSEPMMNSYYLRVKWLQGEYATKQYNMTVGGLRVKKIISYNSDNSIVGTKNYNYMLPDSATSSSGKLFSVPNYLGEVTDKGAIHAAPNTFLVSAKYISISSGSNLPMVSTQNSTVGYNFVQEKTDDLGVMGKTETFFTLPGDISFRDFPYPYSISREWLRGFIKENKVYRYNTGTAAYELLRQVTNVYQQTNSATYTSLKVGRNIFASEEYLGTDPDFKTGEVFLSTGWYTLKKETIKNIDPVTGSFNQTVNDYEYNTSYLKQKKSTTVGSNGLSKQNITAYPFDMVSSSRDPAGVYQAMLNKNIIDPVVEQSELTNGNTKLQLTNYIQPYTGVFVPGTIDTRNTITGTNETRIRYYSYDSKGNPLSVSKEGGARVNYKWGYNSQYPIAEFSNALPTEFYSQNFESSTTGFPANISRDSVNAHTGSYAGLIANTGTTEKYCLSNDYITISAGNERVFNYSGWIYSDGPPAELVLFMYRAGETEYYSYVDKAVTTGTGKWTYISKNFLVPNDVVKMRLRLDNNGLGNIWFDDVRIQPREATSATYTYDPLIGVTSKTDNNGQTAIYEYDSFQRLINIKDQNGNIIKNNSYRIKN